MIDNILGAITRSIHEAKAVTKIYHIYDEGDDENYGETEGMFSEEGELLGGWCLNDAHWRGEYMNGFLQSLNIEVVKDSGRNTAKRKAMLQKLREFTGG